MIDKGRALALIVLWFIHIPCTSHYKPYIADTLYGSFTIHEPLLVELIHSNAMQRLKSINQYGIVHFVRPQNYTRFEHSVAVMCLMRKFGASIENQARGLLHDVSHTAFSHLADYLFGSVQDDHAYQDNIYSWYIEHSDVASILEKHHCQHLASPDAIINCCMLKTTLPNLCADRLEYNLYGAYLEGWITQQEVIDLLGHVSYTNNRWVFDSVTSAQRFGHLTLDLNEQYLCSDWNSFICTEGARLLRHAYDIKLITEHDLIFSTDAAIWEQLCTSSDPVLQKILHTIKQYKISFTSGTMHAHDYYVPVKCRGIDPLIATNNQIKSLRSIDASFARRYNQIKENADKGHYIVYKPTK